MIACILKLQSLDNLLYDQNNCQELLQTWLTLYTYCKDIKNYRKKVYISETYFQILISLKQSE